MDLTSSIRPHLIPGTAGIPQHAGPQNPRWYALCVRSQHEKVVDKALQHKGYLTCAPTYRLKRKRSDRTEVIETPLFPCYVFCHFDPTHRLPVLTTPGVLRAVGAGNIPEPVDEGEIGSLQALVKSRHDVSPWPFLAAGQKVRIEAGPLVGAEGILLEVKYNRHLVVSVSLLQRSVAVRVDQDSVVPVY